MLVWSLNVQRCVCVCVWVPLSPSVSDSGVFFERGAESGELFRTSLQHVVLHISLEGAVEVLEGVHFVQRKDLNDTQTRQLKPPPEPGAQPAQVFAGVSTCCCWSCSGREELSGLQKPSAAPRNHSNPLYPEGSLAYQLQGNQEAEHTHTLTHTLIKRCSLALFCVTIPYTITIIRALNSAALLSLAAQAEP